MKEFLKKAFPFISAAATAGGPLGILAAGAVGKALGVDKVEPTIDGVASVIAKAQINDPETLFKLEQEEHRFKAEMEKLGFSHVEELERIAASDRASAREREIALRDITTRILAYVIVGGFFAVLISTLFGYAQVESAMAGALVGYASAKAEQVVTYYFGSSAGSARKTELLNGKK